MKKIALLSFALVAALMFTLTCGAFTPSHALGTDGSIQAGVEAARGTGQPATLFGDTGVISTVTNTLLFLAGALAVIMIIVGGLRYVTSGGKAASVTAAKNTIMYALVGLIVAFLAFALVNWILGAIMPGAGSDFTNL